MSTRNLNAKADTRIMTMIFHVYKQRKTRIRELIFHNTEILLLLTFLIKIKKLFYLFFLNRNIF